MPRYWFRPKRFWKWFAFYHPVSRKGWAVTLILLGIAGLIFSAIDSRSHSVSDTLINFAPFAIVLMLIFDTLCFRYGEYPAWWRKRNGRKGASRLLFLQRWFDWWSIPHFLFGVVMALLASVLLLPLPFVFVVTLGIAILWEWFESFVRLREASGNSVVDVLLPLVSFIATSSILGSARLPYEQRLSLFIIITLLYLFLNFLAWRARMGRDHDFDS